MSGRNWEWDTGDVLDKRCSHCSQPMCFDRAAAVVYLNKSYHSYCLLDLLTKFHIENRKIELINEPGQFGWGYAP